MPMRSIFCSPLAPRPLPLLFSSSAFARPSPLLFSSSAFARPLPLAPHPCCFHLCLHRIIDGVVGRFFRDRYVMWMTFDDTGGRDAHKPRVVAQSLDIS